MIDFIAKLWVRFLTARFRLALLVLAALGMPRDGVEKRMRMRGELETRRKLLQDSIAMFDSIKPVKVEIRVIDEPTCYVYFILNKRRSVVKVGRSSNPYKRLRALQTSNADPLMLLCAIEGPPQLEKTLHGIFDSYRLSGEWFRYDGELKEYVELQLTGN